MEPVHPSLLLLLFWLLSKPDSRRPHGLWPARLLCLWDFPGKNAGVGGHFLLQGIFLTQGSNPDLLHCRWILCRGACAALLGHT